MHVDRRPGRGGRDHAEKPLIGVLLDFRGPIPPSDEPDGMGRLVTFSSPGDAVRALGAITEYAGWRARDPGAVPLLEIDELAAKRGQPDPGPAPGGPFPHARRRRPSCSRRTASR